MTTATATIISKHLVQIPGYQVREFAFKVPLCHPGLGLPEPPKPLADFITVAVREVTKLSHVRAKAVPTKHLVYLQGGPGFPAPSMQDGGVSGWVARAAKDYVVLLFDQRGTGLSTPVTVDGLCTLPTPELQAAYLSYFRADSIVADLEAIRGTFTGASDDQKWSLLGQSYGGFLITRYADVAPEALENVFFTGGIPITAKPPSAPSSCDAEGTAEFLYRSLAKRVIARSERFYTRYPADEARVNQVVALLRSKGDAGVPMPDGAGRMTVRRFASFGIHFGFAGGFDALHNLLQTAFLPRPDGTVDESTLSHTFLRRFSADLEAWVTNPIYAILHESIYADGAPATRWTAERVLKTIPEFAPSVTNTAGGAVPSCDGGGGGRFIFTGEMVFPWMFRDVGQLTPLQPAAELLAAKEWGPLYGGDDDDTDVVAKSVKGAAIVYYDDMYVEREFSEATAQSKRKFPDVALWVTNQFDHGGLRSDGAAIVDRLFELAAGDVEPR